VTVLPFIAILGSLGAYALGSLALRGAVASQRAATLRANPLELVARFTAIALNAGLNVFLWHILVPSWGLIVGAVLAVIGLGSFSPLATRDRYQSVLGWSSWLMPMSWPSTALGAIVFVVTCLLGRVRADAATGTIETSGLPPMFGFRGGLSLGNFTFLMGAPPTPFRAVGISAHEIGHTLNVAAFGSVWHLLGNGIEQNLPRFGRGAKAYGELMAESHRPDPEALWLAQWGRGDKGALDTALASGPSSS